MKLSRLPIARLVSITVSTVTLAAALGCDSSPQLLTDSEQDSLSKLRSGQYTLISNQDLSALKHDADTGKNLGRYQIHNEGFRTWRLDTATGQVCLLLTSQSDWNKPETEEQSCTLTHPAN
jgi:hypothetical protein